METIDIEEALSTFPELIQKLSRESHKVKVTSDKGSVVVLSEETYENLLVTLEFLSAPGLLDGFRDSK
ncbi:MAG: hypothetical protein KDK62_03235 [Chlamydiia bacterium]|nr:hypothetical protein [Chlamydiia bacterium]